MFIGHTAIALAAKRVRPSIPLAALLAAAYGADVIEITLLALWRWAKFQAAFGSHSLPSVALGAVVVAVAYGIWRRDVTGALLLAATYASHWAADLFTGTAKPTWSGGPTLGLSLYEHPILDFVVESSLLLAAWLVLWPARDRRRNARLARLAAPVSLVLVQLAFNVAKPVFGVRSIKSAVSSARDRDEASSAAIAPGGDRMADWRTTGSPHGSCMTRRFLLHSSGIWQTTAGLTAWSLSYASPAVRRSSTSRRRRHRT